MIPKRIFYAWFGGAPYPDSFIRNKKTWTKYNPDFEIIELNENNFDVTQFEFTNEMYANKNWAFVSDVARIWAINEFGGIYLDTDVEVLKSFDFICENNQFWAKEDIGMVNTGLIFGSKKNDVILKMILDIYSKIEMNNIKDLSMVSTVRIVSDVLKDFGLTNTKKTDYLSDSVVVYTPNLFAPLHYWGGGSISKKTITVHHYSASWTKSKNIKFNFIRYLIHQAMYYFPILNVFGRKIIDTIKLRKKNEK